jgi:hypothetical protein
MIARLRSSSLLLFVQFLTISTIYLVSFVPNFFSSIYAEDGSIYVQNALDQSLLETILRTYAGYLDVPARLIGWIVSNFEIHFFPIVIATLVTITMAVLLTLICNSVNSLFLNQTLSFLFAVFLLILPIARFESIGNITNLHFYFFVTAFFVILNYQFTGQSSTFRNVFCLLASLSIPLTLIIFFLYPLRANSSRQWFISWKLDERVKSLKNNPWTYMTLGLMVNLALSRNTISERSPMNTFDLQKSTYLFFERVIGRNIVPFWGHASGSESDSSFTRTFLPNLEIRLLVASAIFFLMTFLIFKEFKKGQVVYVYTLMLVTLYSFSVSILYNLEPRYAIFPGYLVIFLLFLRISTSKKRALIILMFIWMLMLTLTSREETKSRIFAPDWRQTVESASANCAKSGLTTISMQIAPFHTDKSWFLTAPCVNLRD